MSAYIDTQTLEYPLHQGDIRLVFPQIGEIFECPDRYSLVDYIEPPEVDSAAHQYAKETSPVLENGKWIMQWEILTYTNEEIAEMQKWVEKNQSPRRALNNVSGSLPNVVA